MTKRKSGRAGPSHADEIPRYRGRNWISARFPDVAEEWPSPRREFFIGANLGDAEIFHREACDYVADKPWVGPSRTTYFLCDVHADAEAFAACLVGSGAVIRSGPGDEDYDLTDEGRKGLFIIGGDCLDKGPSNLRFLRALRNFMDRGPDVEILAGNHDLRTILGISFIGNRDPRYAHLFVRMGRKSIRLFKEVYDEYLAHRSEQVAGNEDEARAELFPDESWFDEFPKVAASLIPPRKLNKELVRIREKREEFWEQCREVGMTLRMVRAAAIKCRELFMEPGGEFEWLFTRMNLAYRAGSFLFVHAGVDDGTAATLNQAGTRGLNDQFHLMFRQDLFTMYHGSLGSTFRTKYRDIDFPLTTTGVNDIHRAGIYAIVHGHKSLPRGQKLTMRHGILNFECDCSVDFNTRQLTGLEGAGGAVTVIKPDCRVIGVSTDYPAVRVFDPTRLSRRAAIISTRPTTSSLGSSNESEDSTIGG